MKSVFSIVSVLFLISCAHTASSERTPAQIPGETGSDKAAPLKPEEITVWSLQALAQNGQTDVLNDLFNNHGLPIAQLPEGYAAGAGAKVLGIPTPLASRLLDELTGANWRGKIFFPSNNPRKTMGLNRIKRTLVLQTPITPMASFVAQVFDKHPLVPAAKSPVVTLNYAKPVTKNYWQELALTQIQVYDVMVPVPGKYGPVFIGKTWVGKYAKDRSFTANDPDQLIAWYFLDFNAEALSVQKAEHWDQAKEKPYKMPMMKDSSMPVMPEPL